MYVYTEEEEERKIKTKKNERQVCHGYTGSYRLQVYRYYSCKVMTQSTVAMKSI